jgi:hypothetical protein
LAQNAEHLMATQTSPLSKNRRMTTTTGSIFGQERTSDTEPFGAPTIAQVASARLGTIEKPTPDLKKASDDLKERIADAKRRHDMPVDSALGNPDWEERAADGHLDHPEVDDD